MFVRMCAKNTSVHIYMRSHCSACSYAQAQALCASHPELLAVCISFLTLFSVAWIVQIREQLVGVFDFKAGPINLFGITSISCYPFFIPCVRFTPPKGLCELVVV